MELLIAICPPLVLLFIGAARSLSRGLNPADESYLIYGTLNLMNGHVPIRDFRSYDPGRYLFCAIFFVLLGPGYISARIAMVFLSTLTVVAVALFTLWFSGSATVAAITGCLSVLWLLPNYKQGEILLSVLITVGITLVALGSNGTLLCVAVAAIAAIYAHNILVYIGTAGLLFLLAQLAAGEPALDQVWPVIFWTGVALFGLFVAGTFVRGYWRAFWSRKVKVVVKRGTANLPLPRPWLWSKDGLQIKSLAPIRRWSFKLLFSVLPIVFCMGLVAWIWGISLRSSNAGVALFGASIVGLACFHHFWSRADFGHLTMIAQPIVILLAAITAMALPTLASSLVLLILCAATVYFLWPLPEFADKWLKHKAAKPFNTRFETLMIAPHLSEQLNELNSIIAMHSAPGTPVFVVPMNIASLVVADRPSAVYDCFPVHPATEAGQSAMLHELDTSCASIAVIGTQRIDGNESLLFANNFNRVAAYIEANYTLILETRSDRVYLRQDLS